MKNLKTKVNEKPKTEHEKYPSFFYYFFLNQIYIYIF